MTTSSYPDSITKDNLLETVVEMSRLREIEDISDFQNLNNRFVAGRGLFTGRTTPSSSSDVLATDSEGDIANDGTYEYKVLDFSGTLKWDRRLLDTAWAAASTGALEFIETQVASTSAVIDFKDGIDSTAAVYVIFISDVVGSANQALRMFTSTDGGDNFDTGSTDYSYAVQGLEAAGSDNDIKSGGNAFCQIGAGTSSSYSAIIELFNPSATSETGWYTRYISSALMSTAMGRRLSSADVDAFRIGSSTGTFTSGRFTLYKILHA